MKRKAKAASMSCPLGPGKESPNQPDSLNAASIGPQPPTMLRVSACILGFMHNTTMSRRPCRRVSKRGPSLSLL